MSAQTQDVENMIVKDRRERFILSIPRAHAENIGVGEGDSVSLRLRNYEGTPMFEIVADDSYPMTRKVRIPFRGDGSEYHITLPKTVISMLGLHENEVTLSSDATKIIAAVAASPHVDSPIDIHELGTDSIYHRGNVYVTSFPKTEDYPFTVNDAVWLWGDTLEGTFVIGLDPDEQFARDSATELNIKDKTDSYEVVIPKAFVDSLVLDGVGLTWGHTSSGLLGLIDLD